MRPIARGQDSGSPLPAEAGQVPLPGRSLARVSSGEQVRLYVRGLIFDGVLRPGQRVPQDAIARTLGVSRIPVREALIALEHEGWVTQIAHRGAYVNTLDERLIRDHYELNGLFYGFAVRRAVERRGSGLAQPLDALRKRIARTRDSAELTRLVADFHGAVVAAADSPRLRTVLRQMTDIMPRDFFELVPGSEKVVRDGTAAIVAAIDRGYSELAEREYATMLRRQGDLVVELFDQRGLFEGEPAPESAE